MIMKSKKISLREDDPFLLFSCVSDNTVTLEGFVSVDFTQNRPSIHVENIETKSTI